MSSDKGCRRSMMLMMMRWSRLSSSSSIPKLATIHLSRDDVAVVNPLTIVHVDHVKRYFSSHYSGWNSPLYSDNKNSGNKRNKGKNNDNRKKKKGFGRQSYRFVDRTRVQVSGGTGGKGSVSMHRIGRRHKRRPDGGHGGNGGSIIIMADPTEQSLRWTRPHVTAQNGSNASSQNKNGKNGKNTILRVPCGVVVRRVIDWDEKWDEETQTVTKLSPTEIEEKWGIRPIYMTEEENDTNDEDDSDSDTDSDTDDEYNNNDDDDDEYESDGDSDDDDDDDDDEYESDDDDENNKDEHDDDNKHVSNHHTDRRRNSKNGNIRYSKTDDADGLDLDSDSLFVRHPYLAGENVHNHNDKDIDYNHNTYHYYNEDDDDDIDDNDENNHILPWKEQREKVIVADLNQPGSYVVVAKGGRGGIGNSIYSSHNGKLPAMSIMNNNAIPSEGETAYLELELKLIADIGLVGFPNAGKSSLLSAMSRATPYIAPYPFTTLHPLVGYVEYQDGYRICIADVPGLIAGASQGKGKGHDFLKHLERTKALLYIVDAAGIDGRDPIDDFKVLIDELSMYGDGDMLTNRRALVVANKVDLLSTEERNQIVHDLTNVISESSTSINVDFDILTISAGVTGEGLTSLSRAIRSIVKQSEADKEFEWNDNELYKNNET